MIWIVIYLLDYLDDLDRDLPDLLIYFYLKTCNKPLPWHGTESLYFLVSMYLVAFKLQPMIQCEKYRVG